MVKSFGSIVAVWDDHQECQLLTTLDIFGNIGVNSVLSQG